jgi:hypothetical protein
MGTTTNNTLVKVLPSAPLSDQANRLLPYAVLASQRGLRNAISERLSDIAHVLFTQLRHRRGFSDEMATFLHHILRVVLVCSKEKVVRVDTCGVITTVADNQRAIEIKTEVQVGDNPINPPLLSSEKDRRIRARAVQSVVPASGSGVDCTTVTQSLIEVAVLIFPSALVRAKLTDVGVVAPLAGGKQCPAVGAGLLDVLSGWTAIATDGKLIGHHNLRVMVSRHRRLHPRCGFVMP